MSFSVTKSEPELVNPCGPTPSGMLELSWLDQHFVNRWTVVNCMHVFKHDGSGDRGAKAPPSAAIREALSTALVYYYPLAGRLVESEEGKLHVDCTGDGVCFVEASADCSLGDVLSNLGGPQMVSGQNFIPLVDCKEDHISKYIIMIQVTQFTCGGFIVGLRFHHAVLDGAGAGQFMNTIGDICRGLIGPRIDPVWCREAIPNPKIAQVTPSIREPPNLERLVIDVSLDQIAELKMQFVEATGRTCTTFELVCAKAWRSRARALTSIPSYSSADDAELDFTFVANIRHFVDRESSLFHGGYYGNCVLWKTMRLPRRKIADAAISEVVGLIQDAKADLSTHFEKWAKGDVEEDDLFQIRAGYEAVAVTDWTKVGFSEVDHGWGHPVYVFPVYTKIWAPFICLVNPPAPLKGVRLITYCVLKEHLADFNREMSSSNGH